MGRDCNHFLFSVTIHRAISTADGARPDVEAANPSYPMAYRAGWGYLLLTTMLPHVTAPINPAGGGRRDDIATLFPTMTNIKGNGTTIPVGAIGVFSLDTTTLANGVHTIAWGVGDDEGRRDGIGSRFFTVLNGAALTTNGPASRTAATAAGAPNAEALAAAPARVLGAAEDLAERTVSVRDVVGRASFDLDDLPETIDADSAGVRRVRIPELGRIEMQLGSRYDRGLLARERDAAAAPARESPRFRHGAVYVGAGTRLCRHV